MAKRQFVKKFIKKQKQSGGEIALPEGECSQNELMKILNWYSASDFTDKDRKKWVLEYATNHKLDTKKLKKIHEKFFAGTLSTVCRLATRGLVTPNGVEFIEKRMPELMARVPEPTPVEIPADAPKKPTIQDRIAEAAKVFKAEVDHFVDEKLVNNAENKLKPILGDTGAPQVKHVLAHIDAYIKEFEAVKAARGSKKKEEKELFDAYGMGLRQINSLLKYLESLKAEAESFLSLKKKTRKVSTRKKKVKSPVELCKNVVTAESTLLKPTKLIGSGLAVIYHEKHGTFTYLVAEDSGGLTVQGKSIKGYDEKKSKIFKVKKRGTDAAVIKEINSKTGINALKRVMKDDTKLKEGNWRITGRLSDQSNIIQAV
jgi:hypothetical protein